MHVTRGRVAAPDRSDESEIGDTVEFPRGGISESLEVRIRSVETENVRMGVEGAGNPVCCGTSPTDYSEHATGPPTIQRGTLKRI
jgi:hypothetical protein